VKKYIPVYIAVALVVLLASISCQYNEAADSDYYITVVNADRSVEPFEVSGVCEFFDMTLSAVWHSPSREQGITVPEQATMQGLITVLGELMHYDGNYTFVVSDDYLYRIPMFDVNRENANTFNMINGYESVAFRLGHALLWIPSVLDDYRIFGRFRINEITIFNNAYAMDVIAGSFESAWQLSRD